MLTSNKKIFSTGEVAKLAKVGIETIRFYERKKIIDEPPRSSSGYRQYSIDTIERIQFIKLAQELGFTLKDISELLALNINSTASCSLVKQKAQTKLQEIEVKIKDLKRMQKSLKKLTSNCDENKTTDECPILDAFR